MPAVQAMGVLLERTIIQRMYGRPLDTLLATWGLSLVMQQAFRSVFGAKEVSATLPDWLMGSFKPSDTIDIPINGVFMMGLTVLLTGAIFVLLFRSRWGLQVRATRNDTIGEFDFLLDAGPAGADRRREGPLLVHPRRGRDDRARHPAVLAALRRA